jgi:hypothetical protein
MQVGIDAIGLAHLPVALKLADLARARDVGVRDRRRVSCSGFSRAH